MRWEKKGLVFAPDNNYEWMVSHASLPIADSISEDRIRLYFGTRDASGRSQTSFLEVLATDPSKVVHINDRPILMVGPPGTFDDNGIMPSWVITVDDEKYLYYIGWSPAVTVSYHLAIGLAVSRDGGQTFEKYSAGPLCERAMDEPYFNTAPCVMRDGSLWRMWYVSCTGWETVDGYPEPRYHVKYAESKDGVHWRKTGRVCINHDGPTGAIGRPCVFRDGHLYKMLYSYRGVRGYRRQREKSYRLGYAESNDGLEWVRKDAEVGIERSGEGWDSEMMEYCYYHVHGKTAYLFYNGNGFGKSGFGYAVRIGSLLSKLRIEDG